MPSDIMLTGMRMCCAKYTVHYERKLYLLSAIEASVIPPAEAPRRTTRVRAVSLGPGSCGTGEFMAQLGVHILPHGSAFPVPPPRAHYKNPGLLRRCSGTGPFTVATNSQARQF
jgi:hypothetical protein